MAFKLEVPVSDEDEQALYGLAKKLNLGFPELAHEMIVALKEKHER